MFPVFDLLDVWGVQLCCVRHDNRRGV